MIEYITHTGIFGIFWVIIAILFPFITYNFIKRNGKGAITIILHVCFILFLFNNLASMLIGKTQFDMALTMVKDIWFLCGHIILISIFISIDKDVLNTIKFCKTQKLEQRGQ